jgi:DNA helicase HerA-like ATPase
MSTFEELLLQVGGRYGVLAESNTNQLTVIATNSDIAVGDLFLLPCKRGGDRFYIFRTTQYANILNRSLEMNDIARNKLTMPGAFVAEDLSDEHLIQLTGMILGYAQYHATEKVWGFRRPRRLPQHLSDVYHVNPANSSIGLVMLELMQSQLGTGGLFIGHLLAGEQSLNNVPVYLPVSTLSHHIGIFGRTGCGKSNLMMVLLRSIMLHNQDVLNGKSAGPSASILAIDPHDEFRTWHSASQGKDGIRGIVNSYEPLERMQLVAPFYYLTARNVEQGGLERRLQLSRADLTPSDLFSVMEFSEQQIAFANQFYAIHGERWIGQLLMGDTGGEDDDTPEFLPGTIAAVQRRLSGLQFGNTRVFTRFDPDAGMTYDSLLPDIICSLEQGRLLVVDTTLMTELEQFLVTTVVARTLFAIRKALRTAESPDFLEEAIRQSIGHDEINNQIGMRSLADQLCRRLTQGDLPYFSNGSIRSIEDLPRVNVVIEEAPSILNPARMKFGSVFRDISRQGRKFGIGLTVISQQVSEIDNGVLTQLNTDIVMSLGNELERREAIRNSSADLLGYERELQVLTRGQAISSSSQRDIPLPISIPEYK